MRVVDRDWRWAKLTKQIHPRAFYKIGNDFRLSGAVPAPDADATACFSQAVYQGIRATFQHEAEIVEIVPITLSQKGGAETPLVKLVTFERGFSKTVLS